MPQIQQGQIVPGVGNVPKPYGLDKTENSIPFQERLMRLFKPQEFVTIKNINTEPVFWQYMPADSEVESFSEDGMQRIINRADPEMWVVNPGETEVLVGASAYRALDVMYKNYAAASTLKRFSDPTQPQYNEKNEHLPKNFNFADGGAQEDFIKKAFLGKATPSFGNVEAAPQPVIAAPASQNAETAFIEDPNLPKPKTTEGAPLAKPQYAEPDVPARPAKELTGAKSK